MNFVDPKEYDIPGLVRKNRYKTILPSKFPAFKVTEAGWFIPHAEGALHFTFQNASSVLSLLCIVERPYL